MIWWCGNCFESESLTTQNLIRSGMYYSDDDDDGYVTAGIVATREE
jgi:hypothetical protein